MTAVPTPSDKGLPPAPGVTPILTESVTSASATEHVQSLLRVLGCGYLASRLEILFKTQHSKG